jgi:Na+/H+ antiporter NhaD/arsenite permease-like protein
MVSLLRKLIQDKEDRLFYAGLIVIAANAGGAWSPIGDVTTTMLWIGGQISAEKIMVQLFLPSLICLVIPLLIIGLKLKGDYAPIKVDNSHGNEVPPGSKTIFFVGVGSLIFVPIFKLITHLPPYIGVLFGLGIVWATAELIHRKNESNAKKYNPAAALAKVDVSSVLFFLGILVAIGTLEATGVLNTFAIQLDKAIGNTDIIVLTIGVLSSIIDNVPLVAASMGMYAMPTKEILDFAASNPEAVVDGIITYTDGLRYYQQDAKLWEFLAYCAGTGGSMLIIGSAAGVAVMGMERIEFFWYIKKITFLAFVGYIAGALAYLAIYNLLGH